MQQDQKSSIEHCRKCIGMMRMAGLKTPPMTADDQADQEALYARMLSRYSPAAVTAACREWIEAHDAWPAVAKLTNLAAEHDALVATQGQISHGAGERWPDRITRLLGRDTTCIGAGHISAVMSLKADAARMTDVDVERELRWILQNGYRWRPAPKPIDDRARSRIVGTVMAVRSAPGSYGGKATAEALCSMGEAMSAERAP